MARQRGPIRYIDQVSIEFIKFVINSDLKERLGESVYSKFNDIEDTKGNNGVKGSFIITNLRLIWISSISPSINLSIGYGNILSLTTKKVHSKLRGLSEAIFILTKSENTRYEFIFTYLVPDASQPIKEVEDMYQAHVASKFFRDIRIRSCVYSQGNELIRALDENIFSRCDRCWNLSSSRGTLGTLVITNLRIVWHASLNEIQNISVPYLQVTDLNIQKTKFGITLIIKTSSQSGSYSLGFKVDPKERLTEIYNEISSLKSIYDRNPILTEKKSRITKPGNTDFKTELSMQTLLDSLDESQFIINDISSSSEAYGQNKSSKENGKPVFSEKLCVAIEEFKEGDTLDSLWSFKFERD